MFDHSLTRKFDFLQDMKDLVLLEKKWDRLPSLVQVFMTNLDPIIFGKSISLKFFEPIAHKVFPFFSLFVFFFAKNSGLWHIITFYKFLTIRPKIFEIDEFSSQKLCLRWVRGDKLSKC